MTPYRFGLRERELYGAFHSPAAAPPLSPRVLLCSPFGQEAVRAHRLYRVLAERLAHTGSAVLRFDYYGTGASAGEESDADLPGWTRDVLVADAELKKRAPEQPRSVWLGVGLGATLAALASIRAPDRPGHLILWDPVADGDAYLTHLRVQHNDWLRRSYGASVANLRFATPNEVLGFPLSPLLRGQIEAIRAAHYAAAEATTLTLLASQGHHGASRVAAALRAAGRSHELLHVSAQIEWASEEAMNSALVPTDALRVIGRLLEPAG
jgi:pimeloyl-ACP methyl ester carboxylesterase